MTDPLDKSHTSPKFASPDPQKTAAWYVDFLGFPKVSIFEDGAYAIVRRGSLSLHFWKCEDRAVAENTACYTELQSVKLLNALHAEFAENSKHKGFAPGRIESSPIDQTGHGMREFHVWDPAGNLIGFGAAL